MRKSQHYTWPRLCLGTDYYPEHWDPSLWAEDLERMKQAGLETIRIAEFAWNLTEPREGVFTYDFFDRFLEVAHQADMQVIFSTPTATPPAWLTEKYPEVLNCRIDGVPYRHGMRRHYNYNSPVYRELCARIVDKLGAHYGPHPSIIGWQIDNEINCETNEFYSPSDSAAFRVFLKERYRTLDRLNDAWGTVFWNQTYTDWEEIHVPRLTVNDSTNPHEVLDYSRFISESALSFCRMQSDILRRYIKPGDFITTNGIFGRMDNHRMMDESLDVYTYDSYPNFAYDTDADPNAPDAINDRRWSSHLTEVRSVCEHFGIMEQQSGPGGWTTRMEAPSPKPGQLLLWSMQSIAHGADYIGFFRWRTSPVGTEIYWHGILDQDNLDNRRLEEVKQVRDRIAKISHLAGAAYEAGVALVRDYDNLFDAELDAWHARLQTPGEKAIFRAAVTSHTPIDYLYLSDETTANELSRYQLLIYPHPMLLNDTRARLLSDYVRAGGTLIIGARTGFKDMNGRCPMAPVPGPLSKLTGTIVTDHTLLGPADGLQYMQPEETAPAAGSVYGSAPASAAGPAADSEYVPPASSSAASEHSTSASRIGTGVFSDIIRVCADDVQVLARYTEDYYAGAAALTRRSVGQGQIYHYGGTFTSENTQWLLQMTGNLSPWAGLVELPEDCELAVRTKDGRRYFYILNYAREPRTIRFAGGVRTTDLDTGEETAGAVTLPRFGTRVYEVYDANSNGHTH